MRFNHDIFADPILGNIFWRHQDKIREQMQYYESELEKAKDNIIQFTEFIKFVEKYNLNNNTKIKMPNNRSIFL